MAAFTVTRRTITSGKTITSPRLLPAGLAAVALSLAPHGVGRGQEVGPSTTGPSTISADYISIQSTAQAPEMLVVSILSELPHDPQAFTQGLLLDEGLFIESTGQYGHSDLREVDVVSGAVLRSQPLPASHFGEGVALVGDRLIQLTWREGIAHVWDRQTLEKITEFTYTGEGWGLVYDGTRLIMSNGSDILQFRDPETFELLDQINVTIEGQELRRLNELEFAEGLVWANVWTQDFIVGIDPDTGVVKRVVDARSLRPRLTRPPGAPAPEVLNGIAYNEAEGTYYLTGKYWPTMFEVQFVPAN